jgi:hypothetical protein
MMSATGKSEVAASQRCPVYPCELNRSTQHSIREGKDRAFKMIGSDVVVVWGGRENGVVE